ncbi:MAG: bifunctional aspartate kinase/homoserine dehydrogenase I [Candidatus Riflebacteria bacterium]|nr:bifunctional aspartate kinase/homoserine dehydrogenase I [Candidatus Riflebacteria bacterium]
MKVMKFGGTSVGNAERMQNVVKLAKEACNAHKVGLVISAVSGITNSLISSISKVLAGEPVSEHVQIFSNSHAKILDELKEKNPKRFDVAISEVAKVTAEYENLLTGVKLLSECSPSVLDHISSLGERASIQIILALLENENLKTQLIDPREFILTDSVFGNASPLMPEIQERFRRISDSWVQVFLMPGFYGANKSGKITTLGRGGSDYSASIMAAAMNAEVLEIWTDVDGIFSADPRIVPEAFVLNKMSYFEAMELAFFGAKVLHPRTIAPVVEKKIPTWIKNSFNPSFPGTLIQNKPEDLDLENSGSTSPVRGLSTLNGVAMIGISGAGMRGVPGVAARVFSAMAREGISVILITQSSSEYSICFCVSKEQAKQAANSLELEFSLERGAGLVNLIEILPDLTILSVVGDQMRSRRGIAGTLFSALASADVNIVAISQGSSERNISAVVRSDDSERSMQIVHQFFFSTRQEIQAFVVGTGAVGAELLEQIKNHKKKLLERGIDLRVCGIANSRKLLTDFRGIDLTNWSNLFKTCDTQFIIRDLIHTISKARFLNPIFVDCTGSTEIPELYPDIFEAGMHIVTPNKKANSSDMEYYRCLRQTAERRKRHFLYGANVGAGLPIIETLKNLIKSGDNLIACHGILSGSLSFIFGCLDDGIPFSEAIEMARQKGFTEPDPRDDLAGLDVARKLLILAREAGLQCELRDVKISSPLPDGFSMKGSISEFLENTRKLNSHFVERIGQLKKKNETLRFLGSVERGICQVGLVEVPSSDPLYHVRGGENAVSLLTDRYNPIPLVVRGYGAGPKVTAAGILADILKTVFWNTQEILK